MIFPERPDLDLYDLLALAESQKGTGFSSLAHKIIRLRDAYSVHNDLSSCRRTLDLLRELGQVEKDNSVRPQDSNSATLISSLFMQTLILYVRATKSKSDHRVQSPISDRLPIDLKSAHRSICDLRDDVIAHYGTGTGHESGRWYKEGLVISFCEDGMAYLANPYTRSNYKEVPINQLNALIDAALPISRDIVNERDLDLHKEFLDQPDASQIWDILPKFGFNHTIFSPRKALQFVFYIS